MLDDGFLHVWSELVAAMHGKATHGYTAEIYAYHLMPYYPGHTHAVAVNDRPQIEEYDRELAMNAKRRLVEICRTFERFFDCKILFYGTSLDEWEHGVEVFDHRVHCLVEVKR